MAKLNEPLIIAGAQGMYCPQGDFFIDPSKAVARALVTHAHSDHARPGCKSYLAAQEGLNVLRSRLGARASIQTLPYGRRLTIGGVTVSFHPAGHVLGSAQIRLEYQGQVWVVSGDYKTRKDATCRPFEPVKCHCFITESTFALPVFYWPDPDCVASEINNWWQENLRRRRASIIYAYSLGKAQRLLSMLEPDIGPIFVHSAIDKMNADYRQAGIKLPACTCLSPDISGKDTQGALILAPPTVFDSHAFLRQQDFSTAGASGWMQIRANRRSQAVDRGFVLSDHADWSELKQVIKESEAENIIVTHGYVEPLVRYLNESGARARSFHTGRTIMAEKSSVFD